MKDEIIKCLRNPNGGSTHKRFVHIFLNIYNEKIQKEVELYSFLCSCDHHYREMFFWLLNEVADKRGDSTQIIREIFDEIIKSTS